MLSVGKYVDLDGTVYRLGTCRGLIEASSPSDLARVVIDAENVLKIDSARDNTCYPNRKGDNELSEGEYSEFCKAYSRFCDEHAGLVDGLEMMYIF